MKVLIVEDDADIVRLLDRLLSMEGFETAVATNFETLAVDPPAGFDRALVDLMLPGVSGLDIVRAFRAKQPETRVMILTAAPAIVDRTIQEELTRLGVRVLSKPQYLQAIVEELHRDGDDAG